jgi:hypothetical protein
MASRRRARSERLEGDGNWSIGEDGFRGTARSAAEIQSVKGRHRTRLQRRFVGAAVGAAPFGAIILCREHQQLGAQFDAFLRTKLNPRLTEAG